MKDTLIFLTLLIHYIINASQQLKIRNISPLGLQEVSKSPPNENRKQGAISNKEKLNKI